MLYRVLADIVVVVHFAFVLYVVFGGLLVLRWRWTAWVHIPALLWGVAVEAAGWICPLTPLEMELRAAAGSSGYAGGFVEYYIIPILYPYNLTRNIQWLLALALIGINVIVYGWVWSKAKRTSG